MSQRVLVIWLTFPHALNCVIEDNEVLLSVPSPSPGSFTQHSASAALYGRVPGSHLPPAEKFGDQMSD